MTFWRTGGAVLPAASPHPPLCRHRFPVPLLEKCQIPKIAVSDWQPGMFVVTLNLPLQEFPQASMRGMACGWPRHNVRPFSGVITTRRSSMTKKASCPWRRAPAPESSCPPEWRRRPRPTTHCPVKSPPPTGHITPLSGQGDKRPLAECSGRASAGVWGRILFFQYSGMFLSPRRR